MSIKRKIENLLGGEYKLAVKDGMKIGKGVSVMPAVTIGKHCVIGAGSVVTKDIPDGCLLFDT